MVLRTSLQGRVTNTSLPKTHALLPLLEAVVNGIQAIDARNAENAAQGTLLVTIERERIQTLGVEELCPGRTPLNPIVGFTIEDDGVGFTDENMTSFETLDSDFKSDLGCRGVGRLLWLKAFECVEIVSVYLDAANKLKSREFSFSIEREVVQQRPAFVRSSCGTTVKLIGFKKQYQEKALKSVRAIAREVFEHCIWYFLRSGGAPRVLVQDEEEVIVVNELLDEVAYSEMPITQIEVKGKKFDLLGMRLKTSSRNMATRLNWCAADRVVRDEDLAGKVEGLSNHLTDSDGSQFTYVCYLTSQFLDNNVRADRTAFDLPEKSTKDTLFNELSMDDIRQAVYAQIEVDLKEPLALAKKELRERVEKFVATKAPKYRPLLKRMESLGMTVDPHAKEQDLELELHRCSQSLEREMLAEGQAIFEATSERHGEEYDKRLAKYLERVTELHQSDLANYVSRRRTTLDILRKMIEVDDEGNYSREDLIHNLLFPMHAESTDVPSDSSNLWILDERLVFHDFLASDKSFKKIPFVEDDSLQRPDILSMRILDPDSPVLAGEGRKVPLQSIVVVELKRPMRDDAGTDNNPIQQCLKYVERVRSGSVKTHAGRLIPKTSEAPAFCYVIADLTPSMADMCKLSGLQMTHDGTSYFGYNDPNKAYIEVISFDRLVEAAMQRNRAFFDKLGLPVT